MLASAIGTVVGNPLTFPFIWASTYSVGNIILGRPAHFHFRDVRQSIAEQSLHAIWPIIGPMALGAIAIGVPAALVGYGIAFFGVRAFRAMRRERLEARRHERRAMLAEAKENEQP